MYFEILILILVAFLWGVTNPLIKKGTSGIGRVKGKNKLEQFCLEIKYLITNWKYIIPFLLNQSGSVVYIFALHKVALSIAVPVTNSLTFVFTAITGQMLGETPVKKKTYLGMVLIILGTSLCILDSSYPIDFV